MYNQTNNVNIKPKSYLPEFHVSQNDVGRTLTAHLVSDDGDVTIPAGATVTMAGTKPSGLGYTVTGTIDGSDVSFDTDAVMTDEPGRIVSEIRIVQGDTVIGTTNVVLSVEPNPHPDDVTDGQREPLINEITALLEQITEQADRVEEYSGKVLGMTVTAHESETATVTKTEGEVVNLDFGLPRGPQGIQGVPGQDGTDGVTPDFSVGAVETLAPGEQATATITGTEEDPVLNLGIPQGAKGDKGDPGEVTQEEFEKLLITDTASGEIATFPDGAAFPMRSLKVSLSPIQSGSGTPSPDNVRPISGWDEVETYDDPAYGGTVAWNQLQANTTSRSQSGVDYVFADGVLTVNGTATANSWWLSLASGAVNWDFFKNHVYFISLGNTNYNNHVGNDYYWYFPSAITPSTLSNNNTIRKATEDVKTYLQFIVLEGQTANNVKFKPQLFDLTAMFGSTIADYIYSLEQSSAGAGVAWFKKLFPKDYYEYNAGEETTVSAVNGDPYWKVTTPLPTTVYGGTVDLVSGELVIDRAMVTIDGSAASPRFGEVSQSTTADGTLYVAYINHTAFGMANGDVKTMSDKYEFKDSPLSSLHIGEFNASGGYTRFVLADQSITTLNDLNAYLADNPIQLVYSLATPTTIQCDPRQIQTLLGRNNVWSGGEVSVEYVADPKRYIQKMIGA